MLYEFFLNFQMSIFPSQEILNGIYQGVVKTVVWRDINILHKKVNNTFYPSPFIDPSSIDPPLLILNGTINIGDNETKVKITLSRNYINKMGKLQELPTFTLIDIPKGKTIVSEFFDGYQLDISKLIPDFRENPSISNVVKIFTDKFHKSNLFREGKDVVQAIKPKLDEINNTLIEANGVSQDIALYDDLNESLQGIKTVVDQYKIDLTESIKEYGDIQKKQKLTYTPEFETVLKSYSECVKYKKTQEYFTKLVTENIISVEQFISLTQELAKTDFRERISPSLQKKVK
ncbi:hypothetical protein M9Y10_006028 [Tritrichomonas musculus]|uniref:Uncharacterized protein n=1 Tax=Tritrichomonas musculus TaxID=1915356 RepID=A0ABR2JE89_9EUKA